MAFRYYFFLILSFIFIHFASFSVSYEPRNQEVEALMSIRRTLNDPHGVLNNWDEDSVDPCGWSMITCSPENLVIGLGASSQNLSGTLSDRIGNLTNLRQVLLQNNNISGRIPLELGLLSKLQTLDLSNNLFSSVVPVTLGQLNSLQYLRLNNNSLSGAFPVSLAKIPQLAFLDLSFNNLSGPVPKLPLRTFNIVGNTLICGSTTSDEVCSGTTNAVPLSFSLDSSQRKSITKKVALIIGVSLSSSILLLLAIGLVFRLRKFQQNRTIQSINDKQEEGLINLGNLRQFTLRELQLATENFNTKNILGQGGFGNVYKGRLYDGTTVAVKRLKDINGSTGEMQFKTEVEMISLAVHRNLLRLLGFCSTTNERLLIYPYMSNGSVASRLRVKPTLDWNTRKRIALGTGRGLMYLHEQCDPKIIHRDVKAANVLLDDYCEAIVGDFGLAKLLDHADSHVTTAVRGTVGHIAPEYLSTGQSSEKTDVFGFGILLLELITGMRALDFGKSVNQKGAVIEWVKKLQHDKKVEVLVDKDLGTNYDRIEVGEMVQVALLCTQYLPAHRPKMSEVIRMLEGDGLADKWEANQKHQRNLIDTKNNNKLDYYSSTVDCKKNNCTKLQYDCDQENDVRHVHNDDDGKMCLMLMDDDDNHSLDAHAMVLSGPR
ncbi:hypothetical protein MKX01_009485 [Papaver californicum]|nr:hypothetical protein MKX01_009485 [Papaver californicum]